MAPSGESLDGTVARQEKRSLRAGFLMRRNVNSDFIKLKRFMDNLHI